MGWDLGMGLIPLLGKLFRLKMLYSGAFVMQNARQEQQDVKPEN